MSLVLPTAMRHTRYLLGLCFVVGCGSAAKTTSSTPGSAPPEAASAAFENPGGMWMPRQLAGHADTLRSLGLALDPAALTDPLAPPLAAVVSLGGCSASFVSPDGLIITNHHCVQGALQYHSTPEDNLIENGFVARTRAEEKWNGPSARVYVTQAISDVSDQILAGLEDIQDDRQRYEEIESREKKVVAACEADRPNVRCSVGRFFRGAEYHLIERLEIRDVRLVYAPAQGVGYFGGDVDNWMWPRHTGDFAFYRAYVGKDGKPATYAEDNVPYQPAHYLRVASKPLRPGDMVMVAGYPGSTNRYRTADEVRDAVTWSYPRRIAMFTEYIAALEEAGKAGEDTRIKAASFITGLQNGLKNNQGMVDGLVKGGLAEQKAELERALVAWIEADPQRKAQYGGVFVEMAALQAELRKNRDRNADFGGLRFSSLLGVASTIVRMAEERVKPDATRDPEFQERNWERIEGRMRSMSRRYDRNIDRALLTLSLQRAARNMDANGAWLSLVIGDFKNGEASINAAVDELFRGTKLEDEELRVQLLREASTETLRESTDPFIRLALALRPLQKEIEDEDKRIAGAFATLEPRYIALLRAHADGELAPDANSTLRVTYGTVRGYRPRADAPMYEPFTKLSQVLAKHRDEAPFDVPDPLLAAARDQRFGSYVDETVGEIPVNFLSDLDITGGNSGSPTLNGRGELVGLVFDGNYEAMASDWLFIPELTRSIHVDIRYALWILDAVDQADHLVEELGMTPSVPAP